MTILGYVVLGLLLVIYLVSCIVWGDAGKAWPFDDFHRGWD